MAVLANFEIFTEIQLLSRIERLRTKSMSISLKISKAPAKILTKTLSEVAGEDGIDSDIDLKKRNKLSFSEGKN